MTPLLPIGLAVALRRAWRRCRWSRSQRRHAAAERATRYRALFQLELLPPLGDEEQILVEKDDGRTSEVEAVHWPHLGRTDAMTLLPVEGDVLGWRLPPFKTPPPAVDYSTWSDEELAAEVERRFGGEP